MPGVQRLQFFLSESPWEAERVNDRRLELLREESATAPHEGGVIVIDDSGDRKDGTATAHVGRQWLGRLGKTDNGIVTVTTVWTDGRVYYPLHATAATDGPRTSPIWTRPCTATRQRCTSPKSFPRTGPTSRTTWRSRCGGGTRPAALRTISSTPGGAVTLLGG